MVTVWSKKGGAPQCPLSHAKTGGAKQSGSEETRVRQGRSKLAACPSKRRKARTCQKGVFPFSAVRCLRAKVAGGAVQSAKKVTSP